jgi:hypothetical protein
MGVYSIELAHILISAASEVEVLMKQICKMLAPDWRREHVDDWRTIIQYKLSSLIGEEVSIDRFGLSFKPWESWHETANPDWWTMHNKVKHERDSFYSQANLQNAINAVSALLLTAVYYYKHSFSHEAGRELAMKEILHSLDSETSFIKVNKDYYGQFTGA